LTFLILMPSRGWISLGGTAMPAFIIVPHTATGRMKAIASWWFSKSGDDSLDIMYGCDVKLHRRLFHLTLTSKENRCSVSRTLLAHAISVTS
jgi:hypothetical protein